MHIDEIKRNILDSPLDRVPIELRHTVEKGMPFTDIHTHIFNYKDVPDKYLGVRMPFKPKFLCKISKILHRTIKKTDTDKLSKYAYFVDVIDSTTSQEIFQKMSSYYPENTLFVSLMMDMHFGIGGKSVNSLQNQNALLI